jgi:hypothetical protein
MKKDCKVGERHCRKAVDERELEVNAEEVLVVVVVRRGTWERG